MMQTNEKTDTEKETIIINSNDTSEKLLESTAIMPKKNKFWDCLVLLILVILVI